MQHCCIQVEMHQALLGLHHTLTNVCFYLTERRGTGAQESRYQVVGPSVEVPYLGLIKTKFNKLLVVAARTKTWQNVLLLHTGS